MTGPCTMTLVSTVTTLPSTDTAKRSRPRGAGPPFFSPTRLYFDPWHGHSNHCDDLHHGTLQPRWTHFWYRQTMPLSMPASTLPVYTFLAFASADCGYGLTYTRPGA